MHQRPLMLNNNTRKTSARVYLLALLSADKLISITDDILIERKGVHFNITLLSME